MLDYIVNNYTTILGWHFIGMVLTTYSMARKKQVIKVGDVSAIGILGVVGPLWLVIILLEGLVKFYSQNKDAVIWASKEKRARSILFDEDI